MVWQVVGQEVEHLGVGQLAAEIRRVADASPTWDF
jgi:hypothetical protein